MCIPNLNRVKIEAEGRCYLPTRLRYHGRVLARYHILAVAWINYTTSVQD